MSLRKTIFRFFSIIFFFNLTAFSQIVLKELPDYNIGMERLGYLETSPQRTYKLLNGQWDAYSAEDEDKIKTAVKVPSVFKGSADLIFEKEFAVTGEQLSNNQIILQFLGLNYSAEISINRSIIYRHSGASIPFSITLPKDILKAGEANLLAVKIFSKDKKYTDNLIQQKFLVPVNNSGIFRDVFLKFVPNVYVESFDYDYSFSSALDSVTIRINSVINNSEFRDLEDNGTDKTNYRLRVFINNAEGVPVTYADSDVKIQKGKKRTVKDTLIIPNPVLWSPDYPMTDSLPAYNVKIQLLRNNSLLDEINKTAAFYSLEVEDDMIVLNDVKYRINGVTYIPSNGKLGGMMNYEQMKQDIIEIKRLGFNTIRFSKHAPHPYQLYLCERIGLMAFIEIPAGSLPETMLEEAVLSDNAEMYYKAFAKSFKNFPSVAAIGLGHSFTGNLPVHGSFLERMGKVVKEVSGKFTYAAFADFDFDEIANLDFYGVQLLNKDIAEIDGKYKQKQDELGRGRVFIAEAGYFLNRPEVHGSTNPHTAEAQAEFFENILIYTENNDHAGFFINTMYDYMCEYHSVLSGYQPDRMITLGILGNERNFNNISYKVIAAKLYNRERVTIPIGTKEDDAPMGYILTGLALALFMGFLVNSGRKFREDASRALLRPYNFFADVRDLRIISGFQTTVLGFITCAVLGLITSSVLFSLKNTILFEKTGAVFESGTLMQVLSYLSWHPMMSVLWLTIASIALLLLLTLLLKIASFIVMNRVLMSNTYYTVIWSLLPATLLIPLAIVLYRVLNADVISIILYAVLLLFALWSLYRLLKGIYVIYDTRPALIYIYSILFVIVVIAAVFFYFQTEYSTVDYLIQLFQEYNLKT